MDTQPLIGITTYGKNDAGYFVLPHDYIDAVRRSGGIPLLIPPGEAHLEPLIQRLDGFVFAGGGDINPQRYQGQSHESIYNIDDERDRSEIETARLILKHQLPTLAICRGLQIFNTLLGGTLFEDVPEQLGDSVIHRLPPRKAVRHLVQIEPDSRLFDILQETELEVASWHHQSIRQPARDFRIVAQAADGVLEAAEIGKHPWFVGVQWHPELTAAADPTQQRLFDALIHQAILNQQ